MVEVVTLDAVSKKYSWKMNNETTNNSNTIYCFERRYQFGQKYVTNNEKNWALVKKMSGYTRTNFRRLCSNANFIIICVYVSCESKTNAYFGLTLEMKCHTPKPYGFNNV